MAYNNPWNNQLISRELSYSDDLYHAHLECQRAEAMPVYNCPACASTQTAFYKSTIGAYKCVNCGALLDTYGALYT